MSVADLSLIWRIYLECKEHNEYVCSKVAIFSKKIKRKQEVLSIENERTFDLLISLFTWISQLYGLGMALNV